MLQHLSPVVVLTATPAARRQRRKLNLGECVPATPRRELPPFSPGPQSAVRANRSPGPLYRTDPSSPREARCGFR